MLLKLIHLLLTLYMLRMPSRYMYMYISQKDKTLIDQIRIIINCWEKSFLHNNEDQRIDYTQNNTMNETI